MPRPIRSDEAINDLIGIWTHIAVENMRAADRLLDELDETFQMLARHPLVGERRPEFIGGNLRSFTHRRYVIYFRPITDGVEIARVLHGSRDHDALLKAK